MNAYQMITEVRDKIGEDVASHWGDNDLLRKLNFSHRQRANELITTPGDWLLTSEDLTPVASVITLPSDCIKPVYLEETTDGTPITLDANVRDRRAFRGKSDSVYVGVPEAYLAGNTLEVNEDAYTTGVTLWYQRRVPDLHMGAESSVAASALGFDLSNKPEYILSYYVGDYVEVMDLTTKAVEIRSLITAYTAAGVATITWTPVDTDVYGTVSSLPEEAINLILLDTALSALAKPSASLDPKYFEYLLALARDAKKDWKTFISTRISGSRRTRITEID